MTSLDSGCFLTVLYAGNLEPTVYLSPANFVLISSGWTPCQELTIFVRENLSGLKTSASLSTVYFYYCSSFFGRENLLTLYPFCDGFSIVIKEADWFRRQTDRFCLRVGSLGKSSLDLFLDMFRVCLLV